MLKECASLAIAGIVVVCPAYAQQEEGTLLPKNVKLETWQGDWRRGGSTGVNECLAHFNKKYPTARVQILDVDEKHRRTGTFNTHVQYQYGCSVLVETQDS